MKEMNDKLSKKEIPGAGKTTARSKALDRWRNPAPN